MHTHKAACGALAMTAFLLLAGCDANHQAPSTAPADKPDANTPADAMPPELEHSIFMSTEVEPPANTEFKPPAELSGAEASRLLFVRPATRLGDPLAGLTADELARFNAGRDEFEEVDDAAEGLGPVFTEAGCGTCHTGPTGGTNGRIETRFGRWGPNGFDPLTELGGSLLQDHAIGLVTTSDRQFVFVPEIVPPQANIKAGRLTTPLFGLGLVDAVSTGVLQSVGELPLELDFQGGRLRWVQADVRLGPGNSGGPLADAEGRVIGVAAMIVAGLALAVPAPEVEALLASSR